MARGLVVLLALCFSSLADAEVLRVPGGQFNLEWQDEFGRHERDRIRAWLTYSAESASLIGGTFPTTETRVLLHKIRRGKGPVPWAHTIRAGNPEGIAFHVNPSKSLTQFKQDWTATHEFSHLYLPYVGRRDIWISEGFASYYQNILMMRKGTLTEQQGWQKLKDGFDRGAADPYQEGTLAEASRTMRLNRAFKRVYWTGALYFLQLDLALRKQGSSLDDVIVKFQACCRQQDLNWDGYQLAEKLDLASDTTLFTQQYKEFEEIEGMPEYRDTLSELGISYTGKTIRLSGNESQRNLRAQISTYP